MNSNFETFEEVKNYLINYKKEVKQEELKSIYNTQKEYYKKAIVKTLKDENIKLLYSYNTLVGVIINDSRYLLNDKLSKKLLFSNTTLKHLKDFLIQNIDLLRLSYNVDGKITKNDIIKMENKDF